eukprot:6459426-Amphidinium_carterae.4
MPTGSLSLSLTPEQTVTCWQHLHRLAVSSQCESCKSHSAQGATEYESLETTEMFDGIGSTFGRDTTTLTGATLTL